MAHESVKSLADTVQDLAFSEGGTISIDGFYRAFVTEIKTWAREKIDTEEERDALIDATLTLADIYVAPRWPWGWPVVRSGIREFADTTFDGLPKLLAASPPPADPNTAIA